MFYFIHIDLSIHNKILFNGIVTINLDSTRAPYDLLHEPNLGKIHRYDCDISNMNAVRCVSAKIYFDLVESFNVLPRLSSSFFPSTNLM